MKIEGDIMTRGFSMHPDGEEAGIQYAVNNLGYTNSIVDVTETTPGFTAIYGIMSTEEGPISYTIVAMNSEGGFADQNATPREDNRDDWEKFWGPGGGPYFLLNGETRLEGEITFQEGLPIIKGTATGFFGIMTLGSGTGAYAIIFGGGNILLGIDEVFTNQNGDTPVEVWIADENLIAAYRGAKTVFAFVGGVKTAIDFSSGSDLALEVMSVLNDSRSYVEGLLSTDEFFQNEE